MNDNTDRKRESKPLGGELVIPIAALLFTIYYFTTIIDVPWIAQVSAFFVGTILIVLVAILLVRSVLQMRRGDATLGFGPLIAPVSFIPKRLALLGLTLGFIIFVRWLGFTITTFLFLTLAMLLLAEGRRKGLIVALGAVIAICGWLLFVVAFGTRFPEGPFERLMSGLF